MEKNNQPLVSVVIPCYNHEQFVQDSIQSVIDQSYQNIELIIIDDGSKDGSVEMIEQMIPVCKQRFVRFEFRSRPNKGLSATLNEALDWCQGEYYSAIASDDMMIQQKIAAQVSYFLNHQGENVVGVFGGYYLIDNRNKIIENSLGKERKYSFNTLFMHNFDLPAPTALLVLQAVKDVGGYNEELKIEDWYMWLKLTENGAELIYINQQLVKYRSHADNISKQLLLMNKERVKVIENFSSKSNYHLAKAKLEWLAATDNIYVDKLKAIHLALGLLKKDPSNLFSKNLLRFIYHLLMVSK